eukprot:478724_1
MSAKQNEVDSVLLRVDSEEQARNEERIATETEVERLVRESEEAFEPRPVGCCCKDMWEWWICPSPWLSKICDVDHLASHLFMILLGAAIYFAVTATGTQFTANGGSTTDSFEIWFFCGIGVGIVLCIWGFIQMGLLFASRMKAAELLDASNKLREERFKLDENIARTNNVRLRLTKTNERKGQITDEFKKVYDRLHSRQEDMRLLTQVNAQIGTLMEDKYQKLLVDMEEELINSEKGIIKSIYNAMHLQDGVAGLNKREFEKFLDRLPEGYQEKFELKDFDKIAGDDGILDRLELFDRLNEHTLEKFSKNDSAGDPT